MFDFEDENNEIQEWLIGYKTQRRWESFILPGIIQKQVLETLLFDLNTNFDIAYKRRVMGVFEPKGKLLKKGDFIGL